MNKVKTFTFQSNYDQLTIAGLCVFPAQPIIGVIQFVHGMAEHKERYLDVMQYFANKGYLCVIHDHRGHGESILSKSDFGYCYDSDGSALINDTHQLTMLVKEVFPFVPFLLFGHSMGSLIVRAYTKRYDKDIDGLIVSGSPSNNKATDAGKKVVKVLERIHGDHYRSKTVDQMIFGGYSKGFEKTSKFSWLCSDQEVVRAYDEDPLCGFTFTLNGFENLLSLVSMTYDKKGWARKHLDLPVLFIAGADDPCIQSKEKFDQAALCMHEIGYHNLTARLYPGLRHEILNESKKIDVYNDVFTWIHDNF